MQRLSLLLLLFLLLVTLGCAGHSNRHSSPGKIFSCPSAPCGGTVISGDVRLDFSILRETSGEYVLAGTLTSANAPAGTKVDLAVLSFELARDITIFDSFSFPIVTRDMTMPLHFKHSFKPSGGFDGIKFNWDIHYIK